MKVLYSLEERQRAVREYRRTQSVSKTVRNLGYPGRWTLHQWLKEGVKPRSPAKQAKHLTHYPLATKLEANRMLCAGSTTAAIATALNIRNKLVIYSWAQTYRERGEWGLMSIRERKEHHAFPTRASLQASLPDDMATLKAMTAQLLVDKAVMQYELDLIKKGQSVSPGHLSNTRKTAIADALRREFPLTLILTSLSLSASSYYYQRQVLKRPDKHAELRISIASAAKEGRYTYGYRRIWWALRHRNIRVSEKVVRSLMKQDNVPVRYPRRKQRYTSYDGETSIAPPNLVKRNFHADIPSHLWLTDITEFAATNGKVYLSAVMDCYDGLIVGYRTGLHPTLELAEESLKDALAQYYEDPDGRLVVHSDRGTHYRSSAWISIMRTAHAQRSMSKKGYTPDNAACEGFFGRMKNEMYHDKAWPNTEHLDNAIKNYITFYNHHRLKTALNGTSIMDNRAMLGLQLETV